MTYIVRRRLADPSVDQPAGHARTMETHRMGYGWGRVSNSQERKRRLYIRMQCYQLECSISEMQSWDTPFGREACFDCATFSRGTVVLSNSTHSTRDIPVFAQAPMTWKREYLVRMGNVPRNGRVQLTRQEICSGVGLVSKRCLPSEAATYRAPAQRRGSTTKRNNTEIR